MRMQVLSVVAMAVALLAVSASDSQAAMRRGCSSCGTAGSTCTVAPAAATANAAPAEPATVAATPAETKPAVTTTVSTPTRGRNFARQGRRGFSRR